MNISIVNEISLINLNSKVLIKNESININLNNNESQGEDDKFKNIFFEFDNRNSNMIENGNQ